MACVPRALCCALLASAAESMLLLAHTVLAHAAAGSHCCWLTLPALQAVAHQAVEALRTAFPTTPIYAMAVNVR